MKILIYGAGVIGSIFGAKLANAGHEVTMLARGTRLQELQDTGLVLQNPANGKEETANINTIETLEPDVIYDYILVVMQRTQVDQVLSALSQNASPNIVFVVNNAGGYDDWVRQIGVDRMMIGFPSAGGERANGKVNYFIGKGLLRAFQTTTFGEASGLKTPRVRELIKLFREAGIPSVYYKNMNAWQKTHVAMVTSIANALYGHGCDNRSLARSYPDVKRMVLGIKEGFRVLRSIGVTPAPFKMRIYDLPAGLLAGIYKLFMNTKLAEVTMAKHCIAAKSEMRFLQAQFDALIEQSGVPTPAIDQLRTNLMNA